VKLTRTMPFIREMIQLQKYSSGLKNRQFN